MNFLRVLATTQIFVGIWLIGTSLFMQPHQRNVSMEPTDISATLEALKGSSPTPRQIERATEIITMQRDSLATLARVAEIETRGYIYYGAFFLFSGIALLLVHVRARRDSGKQENKQ